MDQNPDRDIEAAKSSPAIDAENVKKETKAAGDDQSEKKRKPWVVLVIFSILVTIIAWVAMVYSEYASFAASVLGLVSSVAGAILVGKGTWRSTAITSAIASGVLVLVFGLLWAALSIIV